MEKRRTLDSGINPYDFFVFGLANLSIFNLILYIFISDKTLLYVIASIDIVISIVFFIDFLKRFFRSDRKSHYFFMQFGWADLLSSVPLSFFKIFRIIRLVIAYSQIKKAGGRKVFNKLKNDIAGGALFVILFVIVLLIEFGSLAILYAESSSPSANITTASDAIWWVYVTITTVGYGDKYPVTNDGRLIGIIVMVVGVCLFAVVTGFVANKFLPSTDNKKPSDDTSNETLDKLHSEIKEIKEIINKNSDK
jgi:voltage-gated potassium channel